MPQEIIMPPTREEFPETNDLEPHSILNLQDLPIQLQVVLGTVTLKLSEIMDLNPGTVFSLPWIGENRVHIFYEDKKIGTGSLVTIDDQLGVCIEEVDNSLTVEGESPMEPGCWHR